MRRLLTLAVLAACSGGPVRVDVPSGAHQSVVLAVDDDGDLRVHAVDLSRDRQPTLRTLIPSYIGSYEIRLTALFYDHPLADLALLEGELLPATEDPKRGLPSATSTKTLSIHGADVSEWQDADGLSPDVAAFRIPDVSVDECLGQGGCFDEDSWFCRIPCPDVAPPDPPLPAQIPAPDCAPGWSAVEVKAGVSACAPWPGDTPECENSDAIFPGEAACHRLGSICPAGAWPTQLPAGTRIYVRENATGGDGSSEASPLGSIQAAIDAASGGEVVVIAAGTYREAVALNKPVTLFGACPDQTIINGVGGAAIVVGAVDTEVRNLTLTGALGISFNESSALLLADATIVHTAGRGINMTRPAHAELHDVLIRDTGGIAIWTEGLGFGRGRAELIAQRVHIVDSHGGFAASHTDLTVEDSMVRRSVAGSTRELGRGATLSEGVSGAFRRCAFDDNYDLGIFASLSSLEIDQVVVRRTKSHAAGPDWGQGIEIQNASVVTVRRSWLDANQAMNLYLPSSDTQTTIEDSVLSRAIRSDSGIFGVNALILGGASSVFRRVVTTESEFASISLETAGEARLEDVTVLGAIRLGINVLETSSHVSAERLRIVDSGEVAINLLGGRATLLDVDILNAGAADCWPANGIYLRGGARVEGARRIAIETTYGGAIIATGTALLPTGAAATRLTASHVAITDSRGSPRCVDEPPQALIGRGTGLLALEGGQVIVDHFSISDSVESGAQIADLNNEIEGTSLDLSYGVIRDNAIGTTISLEDYDARRVTTSIVYSKNNVNILRTD